MEGPAARPALRGDTAPLDLRYGAYPVQLEGITRSGAPFYFRARHGTWGLWTGPRGADPTYLDWCEAEQLVGHGPDPTGGVMHPTDVDKLIAEHLGAGWIGTSEPLRGLEHHTAGTNKPSTGQTRGA